MKAEVSQAELAFRKEARTWLDSNVPTPNTDRTPAGRRSYALNWQRRQYEGGWAGISWPREHGGRALSIHEQIIWYEECVLAAAPSVLNDGFVALHHAGPTLITLGTEQQRAFHLPRILRGEALWCQGFSEPNAGSDLASLQTRGEIRGDELVVSGQKLWSSYADIADYQELLVRTDPKVERHRGLTWVICDMRAKGVSVRPIKNIAGSASFAAVFYDDVRIPIDHVVGRINDGWATAMATLGFERGSASMALQIELQATVERLINQYVTFPPLGGTASCRSDVESRLGSLWAEVAALRSLTYAAIASDRADPKTRFESSMIRLRYAELMQDVQRLGYELSSTKGLRMDGNDLDFTHGYLYGLHETIAGGTSEIQRNIIAERLLALPRDLYS